LKKLEVFDPALCCPTGVCGPSVDPELVRVASSLFILEGKGFTINRYNLGSEPKAFIKNKSVNSLLNEKGPDVLPVIIFNDQVVLTGEYPSNEKLAEWFEISTDELTVKSSKNNLL
jgi:hypothetical protein